MAKLNLNDIEFHLVESFLPEGVDESHPNYLDFIEKNIHQMLEAKDGEYELKSVLESIQWKVASYKADDLLHEILTNPNGVKRKASYTKTASFKALGDLTEKHQAILKVLRESPGISRRQLCDALEWRINQVTPRVLELIQRGDVAEVGTIYDEQTNRNVASLKVVDKE